MLKRRTPLLAAVAAAVLMVANLIPLTIPFVGEQEPDGYMIKTGWPCSFREETRHRVFFEWRDVLIDAAVGLTIVILVAAGSEWAMRSSARGGAFQYADYLVLLCAAAVMTGVNLHEHSTAATTTRGFPLPALISNATAIHHNRVDAAGALTDLAVAVAIVGAAVLLSRKVRR